MDRSWKTGVEGAQHVDRARDAVEGDAFEADFADELGKVKRIEVWLRRHLLRGTLGREAVELEQGLRRVECHSGGSGEGKPGRETDILGRRRGGDGGVDRGDVGRGFDRVGSRM